MLFEGIDYQMHATVHPTQAEGLSRDYQAGILGFVVPISFLWLLFTVERRYPENF